MVYDVFCSSARTTTTTSTDKNNTGMKNVVDKVTGLLEDHFKKHPPQRPTLDTYHASSEGVLGDLWRADVDVPVDPKEKVDGSGWVGRRFPMLLLHDLENEQHKATKVYGHIRTQEKIGTTVLYGTSGAGKTRAALEYLSHNKGFYLLGGDFIRNPGSRDLVRMLRGVGDTAKIHTAEGGINSVVNLTTVLWRYRILLYIRYAIHNLLEQKLGVLSPKEWLLYQLFPEDFLNGDLFRDVLQACLKDEGLITESTAEDAREAIQGEWSVFIDESQRLLEKPGFFLSTDGKQARSNFSAVIKAAYKDDELIANSELKFPVFLGTEFPIDELEDEGRSASAKRPTAMKQRVRFFSGFELLTPADVEAYLNKFLDLSLLRQDVKEHVARWLRGRPRWTATFLETYVNRLPKRGREDRTRVGEDFSIENLKLMEAIDCFLAVMTLDSLAAERRAGWSAGPASAYASVDRLMTFDNHEEARRDFETAVFCFAVGKGHTIFRQEPSKKLIEAAVAALVTTDTDGRYVEAILDEPIIIQASLHRFCLINYLRDNLLEPENQRLGEALQRVLLPVLMQGRHTSLENHFKKQLQDSDAQQLWRFYVSTKSSYGVLSIDVGEGNEAYEKTIDWICGATNSTIEGQVPPFCYPNTSIGPDVVYLMWDQSYTDFRACLVQSKFGKNAKKNAATKTLVPDWLYHKNRLDPKKRKLALNDELADQWNRVKDDFVSDKRPCLRLLVQCPATLKADFGRVAPDGMHPKDKGAKKAPRDWLVTICNDDLGLFDEDTASILRLSKKLRS
ncbi:hypothetical protein IV203_030626 [Nitzschia inconspicua]|uniref:Uncharacterized protein n=1 Tax=Nitzschia inconspicua TaxID=303405 RepID=A0A9K3LSU0_9STRA|nr:hypothetical protein IV203_015964 [Nitzschia inconspicua]KAG7367883.1 hypothetical protein IV203_030626 [Nitzschia inconspicua]